MFVYSVCMYILYVFRFKCVCTVCMHLFKYACMYVCIYMYVCMYVCMYMVFNYKHTSLSDFELQFVRMYCIYVYMYVCMYVWPQ